MYREFTVCKKMDSDNGLKNAALVLVNRKRILKTNFWFQLNQNQNIENKFWFRPNRNLNLTGSGNFRAIQKHDIYTVLEMSFLVIIQLLNNKKHIKFIFKQFLNSSNDYVLFTGL